METVETNEYVRIINFVEELGEVKVRVAQKTLGKSLENNQRQITKDVHTGRSVSSH